MAKKPQNPAPLAEMPHADGDESDADLARRKKGYARQAEKDHTDRQKEGE